MQELSPELKFIDSIEIEPGWEIETDTGYKPISNIYKTIEYEKYILKTEHFTLECADNHIVFLDDYTEVFVKDLCVGDNIVTSVGIETVISIENTHILENMYDITVDDDNHRFYSNNILSHNTTITTIFLVWYIIFNEDKSTACLANKLASAREILSRIQLAYSLLPKWLQQGVVEYNKGNIELENGSKLFVAATTSDSVRGKSFSCIYLDEVAFVPEKLWNKFFTSTYPTISSGKQTKLIMTSTPNGHNHFYDFWVRANKNPEDMYPLEINYWDVPGRDEEWKRQQLAIMSEEQFNTEYGNSFDIQSNTLINPYRFSELESDLKDPVESDAHVKIFEKANKDHVYIGTVDCADVGVDYSTISIIDITQEKYEQVAVYRNDKISYTAFPQIIMQFSKLYNDARMLIESNNIGTAIIRILVSELEFENLIYSRNKKGTIAAPGQLTTQKTKSIGCITLKELIEQKKFIIRDIETFKELKNFILHDNGSYAASGGFHDDLIMGLVNFCYYTNTPEFNIYYGDIRVNILTEDASSELLKKQEEELYESLAPAPLNVNKYMRELKNQFYGIEEEKVKLT